MTICDSTQTPSPFKQRSAVLFQPLPLLLPIPTPPIKIPPHSLTTPSKRHPESSTTTLLQSAMPVSSTKALTPLRLSSQPPTTSSTPKNHSDLCPSAPTSTSPTLAYSSTAPAAP